MSGDPDGQGRSGVCQGSASGRARPKRSLSEIGLGTSEAASITPQGILIEY
jgi:hypothetical protein